MSAASHLYPLPFLAVAILAGCSSQSGQPVNKGEKPVDVASVVRQKNAGQCQRQRGLGERYRDNV